MPDIVERLRSEWNRADGIITRTDCLKAADEIERLRAKVETWETRIAAEIREKHEAEAINERLREALTDLLEVHEHLGPECHPNGHFRSIVKARAALQKDEGE